MPLGIGLLASYLLENLPQDSIDVRLYKFTDDLTADLEEKFDIIGFSMYAWNTNLNRYYAARLKQNNPQAVAVCGGPNITYQDKWIKKFLQCFPYIDYLVPFNGEIPLLSIVKRELKGSNKREGSVEGAYYLEGDEKSLIYKDLSTKLDSLNAATSPYLSGLMDKFFPTPKSSHKLAPFIETNRGCPYQCTFCHTSHRNFNKLLFKDVDTVIAEIELFAERLKDYPDIPLYIADNNFGMFNRDNEIADAIRICQESFGWPVFLDVTVGKSRLKNILQVVKKLKPGTLSVFMSAQSMTPEVLKNIKRKNLSSSDFQYLQHELFEAAQAESSTQKNLSSSGIIIGLPGETRESFFKSVEEIIDMGINSFIPYTLMVLKGTPLGDEIYEGGKDYTVKHRIVPQQFGKYEGHLILDTEVVAVATPTMTFDDYLECRSLCFFLQVVYGNDLFQNHIHLLRKYDCSVFGWVRNIMDTVRKDQGKLGDLFHSFYSSTIDELWDSEAALYSYFEKEENYNALVDGKYGANILAKYAFVSRMECFEEWITVVFQMTKDVLLNKVVDEKEKTVIVDFLDEFKEYCLQVKNIARYFEDGFTAEPFTLDCRYNFNDIDSQNLLKKVQDVNTMTFTFSEASKEIIANIKQDTNWRYKLQQLIRIKNGAESLYPAASTFERDVVIPGMQ